MSTLNAKLTAVLREAGAKLTQSDLGSALALYQQAVQMSPDSAGALMGLAIAYNRSGQAMAATGLLERLWKAADKAKGKDANTFKASVLAQMGVARQQLGQLTEAMMAFKEAHKYVPTTDLAQRIDSIKPLLSSPEPVQQLLLSARQMVASNQLDAALKMFSAALQLHADSVEALHGLAMLQRRRGQYDLALPLLQKALILAPDRPDLYNDLGMLFQDRGDFAKAVSFHKRALKLSPLFVFALVNLGVAYKRQGKNSDAIATYQAALKIAPDVPEVHNNLGNLLRIEGQLDTAREHLLKALALQPGYADASTNLTVLDADIAARAAVATKTPATKKPVVRQKAPVVVAKPTASAPPPCRKTSQSAAVQNVSAVKAPATKSTATKALAKTAPATKATAKKTTEAKVPARKAHPEQAVAAKPLKASGPRKVRQLVVPAKPLQPA
jgi:tetratricopeptide (TPR) repeat protein